MSIKNLPINTNGQLVPTAKRELQKIIESEFANKESLYHQVQEQEKEKVLGDYRKSVNFGDLIKTYKKLEKKVEDAQAFFEDAKKAIEQVGLTTTGEPDSTTESTWDSRGNYKAVHKPKAIKLRSLLDAVEANAPSKNLKNKLVTRLNLATTIGEGNEIMREVLGNGIIPQTDIKAITFNG